MAEKEKVSPYSYIAVEAAIRNSQWMTVQYFDEVRNSIPLPQFDRNTGYEDPALKAYIQGVGRDQTGLYNLIGTIEAGIVGGGEHGVQGHTSVTLGNHPLFEQSPDLQQAAQQLGIVDPANFGFDRDLSFHTTTAAMILAAPATLRQAIVRIAADRWDTTDSTAHLRQEWIAFFMLAKEVAKASLPPQSS